MTLQEIKISAVLPFTGVLANLNTADKTNLVNAINSLVLIVNNNYVTQNQKILSSAANFSQSII